MRLHEITQMRSIDQYEPSGNSGGTSVDPDKVDDMLDPKRNRYSKKVEDNKADRSKRLKKQWQVRRNRDLAPDQTGQVVSDNTDLTGAGANSSMNGLQTY